MGSHHGTGAGAGTGSEFSPVIPAGSCSQDCPAVQALPSPPCSHSAPAEWRQSCAVGTWSIDYSIVQYSQYLGYMVNRLQYSTVQSVPWVHGQ